MRNACTSLSLLVVGLLTLSACGDATATSQSVSTGQPAAETFPMTVSSCGREVTVSEAPKRILTVGSVAAPLVAAAGAADRILLRTFETASFPGQYEPALRAVPLITPANRELSREEIIASGADLVISFEGAANSAEDLQAAGINVLVNRGYCAEAKGDFEDIFADIELYGRLLGTSDVASDEVRQLRERVAAVEKQSMSSPANRRAAALIFARGGGSLSAYGNASTVDKQMAILGLTNVFDDVEKRNFEVGIEEIIARDPEVIILLTQGDQTEDSVRDLLLTRTELRDVQAVRNDDIVVLPFGFTGPSPVAVEGLEIMASELADPS